MNKREIQERNREQSKQRLIGAVGEIILHNGFKGLGINAVAKQANLDKVLIYRYFDGMDGLLKAFAMQKDFYINIPESINKEIETAEQEELPGIIVKILVGQLRELQKNRELQEWMIWEMQQKNELTMAIAKEREEKGYLLSRMLKEKLNLQDHETDALLALLVSGIYYLVLRSMTVDVFNGISLNSDKGWEQIEKSIQRIVHVYFDSIINIR